VARSRAALATRGRSDYSEIIGWYVDLLEHTVPRTDLPWEPVRIGPTWQWENGWVLPELTLGWDVLGWCGTWLADRKGQPWQFTPEQTRWLLWFYAVDETGDFLAHSAVLQRLKGWGKDPVAACLSAAGILGPVSFDRFDGDRPVGRDEPDAWVQIVAVSLEQTKNTMKLFPGLITPDARDHYGIQVGKENIWALSDSRQIQAVTSSVMTIEGGRPTLIIRNETQNWNESNDGHAMAGAIEGNAAKSEGGAARILDICNAYRPGEDSVGQRARESWEKVQDERAADFGVMYDSLEAPPDAPLTLEDAPAVVDSIRGDSTWLSIKRIVASIANPDNPPSESRRKWYNQIVAAEDALIDPADWAAAPDVGKGSDHPLVPGEPVVLFFDGSKSDDSTGLVACRVTDGAVFKLGLWQRPPGLPAKQPWIVDRADVDLEVKAAFGLYRVRAFWADPSDVRDDTGERFWEPLIDEWHRRWKHRLEVWAVPGKQGHAVAWDMRTPAHQQQFTGAVERFITDVEARAVPHDHSAALADHVRNSRRRPNKYGVGMGKENRESRRKVDLAVCAVGARMLWRQLLNQDPQQKRSGRVW
jgi:hypothetical protein